MGIGDVMTSRLTPFFIGGDGRSGTTLLAMVLDAHPNVTVSPEIHFHLPPDLGPSVLRCLELLERNDPRAGSVGMQEHPEIKLGVQFVRRCDRAGVPPDALRALVEATQQETGTDLRAFPDRCRLVDRIGGYVLARDGTQRWGLKVMKRIRQAPDFLEIWPDARFLHIVRDGRDVAASQIRDHAWGYSDITEAARGWRDLIQTVHGFEGGPPVHELRYEDLVGTPRRTLQAVVDFLALPWHGALLRHAEATHVLASSSVHHDSAQAALSPINTRAVGRFRNDLTRGERDTFAREAGDTLTALDYEVLPEVPLDFQLDSASCIGAASCLKYRDMVTNKLVGRYIGSPGPVEKQVRAARLDLNTTYDDYMAAVKKLYKGAVMRNARKAERAGIVVHRFARPTFVPDIVEINHSKEDRSGGPMKANYLKSVEESGGYPKKLHLPEDPPCPVHYDLWWGAFEPLPGHRQGEVVTDERLVAYINLRRYGDFAFYNYILGHGDYLNLGVMYHLHFAVMRWILDREAPHAQGLEHLIYAGFFQGGEGLQLWKKKTCFEPVLLVMSEDQVQR